MVALLGEAGSFDGAAMSEVDCAIFANSAVANAISFI
jgi:hypothetical protein